MQKQETQRNMGPDGCDIHRCQWNKEDGKGATILLWQREILEQGVIHHTLPIIAFI